MKTILFLALAFCLSLLPSISVYAGAAPVLPLETQVDGPTPQVSSQPTKTQKIKLKKQRTVKVKSPEKTKRGRLHTVGFFLFLGNFLGLACMLLGLLLLPILFWFAILFVLGFMLLAMKLNNAGRIAMNYDENRPLFGQIMFVLAFLLILTYIVLGIIILAGGLALPMI